MNRELKNKIIFFVSLLFFSEQLFFPPGQQEQQEKKKDVRQPQRQRTENQTNLQYSTGQQVSDQVSTTKSRNRGIAEGTYSPDSVEEVVEVEVDTSELDALQDQLASQKESQAQMNSDLKQLKSNEKNINQQINQSKQGLAAVLASEAKTKAEIDQKLADQKSLQEELTAAKKELQQIDQDLQQAKQDGQELQKAADLLDQEEQDLNQEQTDLDQEQIPEEIFVGAPPPPPADTPSGIAPANIETLEKEMDEWTEDAPELDTSEIVLDVPPVKGLETFVPTKFDETPYAPTPFELKEPVFVETDFETPEIHEGEISGPPTEPELSTDGEVEAKLNLPEYKKIEPIKLEYESAQDLKLDPIPDLLRILNIKLEEHKKIQTSLSALNWEKFKGIGLNENQRFTAGSTLTGLNAGRPDIENLQKFGTFQNELLSQTNTLIQYQEIYNLIKLNSTSDIKYNGFNRNGESIEKKIRPDDKNKNIIRTRIIIAELIHTLITGNKVSAAFYGTALNTSSSIIKKLYEKFQEMNRFDLFKEFLKQTTKKIFEEINEKGASASFLLELKLTDILENNLGHVLDVLAQMAIKNSQKSPASELTSMFNPTATTFLDKPTINLQNAHQEYFTKNQKPSWDILTADRNKFKSNNISIQELVELIKKHLLINLKFLDQSSNAEPNLQDLLTEVTTNYSQTLPSVMELLEIMINAETTILKQIEITPGTQGGEVQKKFSTTFGMLEDDLLTKIKDLTARIQEEWTSQAESIMAQKAAGAKKVVDQIKEKIEECTTLFQQIDNEASGVEGIDVADIKTKLILPLEQMELDDSKALKSGCSQTIIRHCKRSKEILEEVLKEIKKFKKAGEELATAKQKNKEKFETETVNYNEEKRRYDQEQIKIKEGSSMKGESAHSAAGEKGLASHKQYLTKLAEYLKAKQKNEKENNQKKEDMEIEREKHEEAEAKRNEGIETRNAAKLGAAGIAAQKEYDEKIKAATEAHATKLNKYNNRKKAYEDEAKKIRDENSTKSAKNIGALETEETAKRDFISGENEKSFAYFEKLKQHNLLKIKSAKRKKERADWQTDHDKKQVALNEKKSDLAVRKTQNTTAVAANSKLQTELGSKKKEVSKKIKTIDAQLAIISGELEELNQQMDRFAEKKQQLEVNLTELRESRAANYQLILAKTRELKTLDSDIEQTEQEIEEKKEEFAGQLEENRSLEERRRPRAQEERDGKQQRKPVVQQRERQLSNQEEPGEIIHQNIGLNPNALADIARLEKTIENLQKAKTSLNNSDKQKYEDQIKKFNDTIARHRAKIEELKNPD